MDVSLLSQYQNSNTDIGYIVPEVVELKLIQHLTGKSSLGIIFKESSASKYANNRSTFKTKFPPNWSKFIGFTDSIERHTSWCLLNLKYFTLKINDIYDLEQLDVINSTKIPTDDFLKQVVLDKNLSQEVIIYLLFVNKMYWERIKEKYFDILKAIWHNVFGDLSEVLIIDNSDTVNTISLNEWKTEYNVSDINLFLPQPDSEFIITEKLRPDLSL